MAMVSFCILEMSCDYSALILSPFSIPFESDPWMKPLLEGSLARNAFLRESGCTKCCVLQGKTVPEDGWGSLSGGRS